MSNGLDDLSSPLDGCGCTFTLTNHPSRAAFAALPAVMPRGVAVTEAEKPLNFEQAVKRLEEIVRALDDQTLPLDAALALFEEGILVSRQCAAHLEVARARVEKLVEQAPGVFSLEAFDQETSAGDTDDEDEE